MEFNFAPDPADHAIVQQCLAISLPTDFKGYLTGLDVAVIKRLHDYISGQKNMDRCIEWFVNEMNLKPQIEDRVKIIIRPK